MRQKSLEKQKQQLEINKLTYQLQTEFTKIVSLGLIRNAEYRKNIFDSENQQGYQGANGQWVQFTFVNKNLNSTETSS